MNINDLRYSYIVIGMQVGVNVLPTAASVKFVLSSGRNRTNQLRVPKLQDDIAGTQYIQHNCT